MAKSSLLPHVMAISTILIIPHCLQMVHRFLCCCHLLSPTYDVPIQPLISIVNHTIHQTFDCQSHHSLDLPWSYTCPCIYGHCQSPPLIRFEIALHQPCIIRCGHSPIIIHTPSHVTPSPHFKVQRFLPTRFSA